MTGMAEDGGLLLPASYPQIDIKKLTGLGYEDVALEVLRGYMDDMPAGDLQTLIRKSYASFDDKSIIPLIRTRAGYFAELFHGPTYAFKDVALQLLGNLFEYILAERRGMLNIVGATSGDTGSAAIAGVRGKKGVSISILYPDGRVSAVQERQMATVSDDNVHTYAVAGTFDDCQNIVKALFADVEFKRANQLGAVNSINWARIAAQIAYYFYTYMQLPVAISGGKINFVVPTGNFGNVFAGYVAKRMGLPIDKLVIATNKNDILHRLVQNGDYSTDDVVPTHSPSMDIQVSSNLERYLFHLYGNADRLKAAMVELKDTGSITFSKELLSKLRVDFESSSADDSAIEETIRRIYASDKYIIDPHTACGAASVAQLHLDPENTIILATAHPAKFGSVIEKALNIMATEPAGIKQLAGLPTRRTKAPNEVGYFRKILSI
ncbi:threonine synthase [Deferribacterales bacterium RsTz2092]|nr:threonine synthase [Deferribacterales bacterium]